MSVQFGRWNFEGQPPSADYVERVSKTLAPYGPDSDESYSKGGVTILYRAFHTTKESRHEKQPYISPSNFVVGWDGRLDNRMEFISEMPDRLNVNSTDVDIVAAAYEQHGANCFRKLIGDWALSIWDPRKQFVLLAKDPLGTKHLYYSFGEEHLTWSTILDPLVLFAGRTFKICEEYIAGWFATMSPAAHLTPYLGIYAVPPSSVVLLRRGRRAVSKYWDFDPSRTIRYRTDSDYEEHFRFALATSLRRRLRSDRPVLAELSGGMDSASIVCMADLVTASGTAEATRLDTISWFDDSYEQVEPDSNELNWIAKVEEKRGRTGFHINLGSLRQRQDSLQTPDSLDNRFFATPNVTGDLSEHFKQYASHILSEGHRVTLSGLGGDGVTGGGVPTPLPELQNLLVQTRFIRLVKQLKAWAMKMNTSRGSLLREALRGFLPPLFVRMPAYLRPLPWFQSTFVRRNRAALCGCPSRVKLFGPLPSFQDNTCNLDYERRLLARWSLHSELLRDIRYPYLDTDFLQFMYAVPREQIVRIGQRRSLMKRALVGIVPNELLNRRRKAFTPPESTEATTEWSRLGEVVPGSIIATLGIVDPNRFRQALRRGQQGEEVSIEHLKRVLMLESWLSHITLHGALVNPTSREAACWGASDRKHSNA